MKRNFESAEDSESVKDLSSHTCPKCGQEVYGCGWHALPNGKWASMECPKPPEVASQQPAPIPEEEKRFADMGRKYLWMHGDHEGIVAHYRDQLIIERGARKQVEALYATAEARCARLEAALRALRTYMWSEGYADQTAVMRQADAALGTPEKGEK